VYPPIVARQWFGKHVPAATKNLWRRFFDAVRVISKESRRLVLPDFLFYSTVYLCGIDLP
jgi:hypothetical protein